MACTIGVLVVEMYTHRNYFRHTFIVSPALIVSWGGLLTRIYLEERGLNFLIAAAGFGFGIFGLMGKLCLTAVENTKENSKY